MMFEVNQSAKAATLEDYLESIRARKWVVIGSAIAGLVLVYFFADSRTPSYTSEAAVVVNPTPVGSPTNSMVTPNLERESAVIISDEVAIAAVTLLGTDEDPLELRDGIDAAFVPQSDVIRIEAQDEDPLRAAGVVNAFADAYVNQRLDQQDSFYTDKIDTTQQLLDDLTADQNEIVSQLSALDSERSDISRNANLTADARNELLGQTASQRQLLVTDQNGLSSQIRIQQTAITDLQAAQRTTAPAAAFLSRALPSDTPNGLSTPVLAAVGGLLGLLAGVATAFLQSRLDRSASSADEVTVALDAPVLGTLPDLGWRNSRGASAVAMLSPLHTARIGEAKEGYRRLRTAIEFLMRTEGVKTLLVTSSHPGEGKSVTSTNLAVALAAGGTSVALINADMRRPTLELLLGRSNGERGLSTYLGGLDGDFEHLNFDNVPNLVLVPAGPIPANPGELLASDRFRELLEIISEQVDLVIVDTPPVGATADSAAASRSVDGVIVIADAKSTSLEELRLTRADLDRAGANIVGSVINRDPNQSGGMFRNRGRYSKYSYSKSGG